MVYGRQIRYVYSLGIILHSGMRWMMMSQKEMTIEEYSKYFDQFDPVDYDPKKWVRLAKKAGMKYVYLQQSTMTDFVCLTLNWQTTSQQTQKQAETW